jgi:serine/threonine-protein kinase
VSAALCPICGRRLTGDDSEAGPCRACLRGVALEPERTFVGDYEQFQLLGEGGMGTVYLARHVTSDERVALKIAKKEVVDSPTALALFRQQGKTESGLHHPNILRAQGAGTHEGHPFFVTSLMEGGSLAERDNAARFAPPRARSRLSLGRSLPAATR